MSIEIERKFLVNSDDFKKEAYQKNYIKQGFLNANKNRVVRVRLNDNKGFITVKGKSNEAGLSRFEWEKEISKTDAESLLFLCEEGIIEKYRYLVKAGNHTYEIDEFLGDNKNLIVAEIELLSEEESFLKPNWIAEEVTGNVLYYNSNLSKHPYKDWR